MVTRTRRIFSPEFSPSTTTTTHVRIPAARSTIDTQGKEKVSETAWMEASSKDVTIEDPFRKKME